jgi:hypothetical protein
VLAIQEKFQNIDESRSFFSTSLVANKFHGGKNYRSAIVSTPIRKPKEKKIENSLQHFYWLIEIFCKIKN